MKVRCYPTIEQVDREAVQDSTVVVIDVLRATSTIIAGIENGASSIIPVDTIETASRLVGPSDHGVKLLAGERKGLPIEGFDLFNSPLDFNPDNVRGKTVILTTSNGTRAIVSASKADRIIICAINNVGAVADSLRDEKDLVILCSGTEGCLAVEDMLCGGMLLEGLGNTVSIDSLDDAGKLFLLLAGSFGGDVEDLLRTCDRGRELLSLGYEADIIYCAIKNSSKAVPEVRQGAITG
jgi:2-phosphosulfolactate phosphatase